MTDYLKFKDLHTQPTPLLLGNVWNVYSAQVLESAGFQALGTSSAAMAHSLGYEDGEQMPFADLLFMVEKIKSRTCIPLSVDIESGYGETPEQVIEHIEQLYNLGVAGINMEDSLVAHGQRRLKSEIEFCTWVDRIVQGLAQKGLDVFMNIRCDAFLLSVPDALQEGIKRVKRYQALDIDGIFLPGLTSIRQIEQIPRKLPLNLMCMPELPDFKTLTALGIQRISMGDFLHNFAYNALDSMIEKILKTQSFHPLWN